MHAVIYAPTDEAFKQCTQYVIDHGIEVIRACCSNGMTVAPLITNLDSVIATACEHQSLIVVYRLPDLADSLKGLRDLTRRLNAHGAAWATVAESLSSKQKPVGKLLEALAVIEHEAHVRKGQRAASARKGKVMTLHPGKVRFGWKLVDGQLVEDEREQQAIRLMLSCHEAGHGLPAIIEALIIQGFQPRGKRWFPDTVAKVLKREAQEQTQ